MTSAHLSIIPEFLEKIEVMKLQDSFDITKTEITNRLTGDKILFRGIKTSNGDQTANLKSLQGITTWVLDEAEELIDEETFDKIDLSIRQQGVHNRVILILNPATKEHWIYKRFFEQQGIDPCYSGIKDNVCYVYTNYLDNKENLSKSYLDSVELMRLNRPDKYKHQILGAWRDRSEGVILTNWVLGQYKEVGVPVYGQDFGFSNDPTTLIQTSIDKKNKRIYIKEHVSEVGLTTSDIVVLNKRYAGESLIIGDSAEPRLIEEIKRQGLNILAVKKGKDSIRAGLSYLLDYQLVIDPSSINVIKELNNYTWSNRKSETPNDSYNHCIDAIRYAIYYQLQNNNKGEYYIL